MLFVATAALNGLLLIVTRDETVDPDGIITTVAGSGTAGFSGDGGSATLAQLSDDAPRIALGPKGSLYIVEASNHRIRKVVL